MFDHGFRKYEIIKLLNDIKKRIKRVEENVPTQIDNAINQLLDGAPEALDTLKELADALGNNPDILTELNNKIDSIDIKKDWNQNDEDADDYIENRTHYFEKGEYIFYTQYYNGPSTPRETINDIINRLFTSIENQPNDNTITINSYFSLEGPTISPTSDLGMAMMYVTYRRDRETVYISGSLKTGNYTIAISKFTGVQEQIIVSANGLTKNDIHEAINEFIEEVEQGNIYNNNNIQYHCIKGEDVYHKLDKNYLPDDVSINKYSNNIEDYVYDINDDPFILDPGEKEYAYGVLVDFRDGKKKDSDGVCTRIGNMDFHRTLPCHTHKGEIYSLLTEEVLTELNPENWNLAYNGHTAEEIASMMADKNNTIEIHTDRFYCTSKVLHRNLNGNPDLFKVMFSPVKINDRYFEVKEQANDFRQGRLCEIDGNFVLAANLADISATVVGGNQGNNRAEFYYQVNNNGKVPITKINRINFRRYAGNRNLMNYYTYQYIIYWAFVIEYNTLNSQKSVNNNLDENGYHQGGLGIGMTSIIEDITNWTNSDYFFNSNDASKSKPTVRNIGVTNSLGNGSGEIVVQENGRTYHQNRYRGFEFPFGDLGKMIDGFAGFVVNKFVYQNENANLIKQRLINYYLSNNPNDYADTPNDAKSNMELVASVPTYSDNYSYDEGQFKLAIIGDKALLIPCENDTDSDYDSYFCNNQYGGGDYSENDGYVGILSYIGSYANNSDRGGLAYLNVTDSAYDGAGIVGVIASRFINDN